MLLAKLIVLLLIAIPAHFVSAASTCVPQRDSAYEAVFCKIKVSRYGQTLPTLDEFRRNVPQMQYLLIKRSAARLSLPLQAPAARAGSPAVASNSSPAGPASRSRSRSTPRSTPRSTMASGPSPKADIRHTAATATDCQYFVRRILCSSGEYQLRLNQSNKHLQAGVLDSGNMLVLGSPSHQRSESDWLATAYTNYLNAMLSIGLAGSSFTYSAFAHVFYEHRDKGTDFSARFQKMFEVLKKDKQTLAVSRRTPKRAPKAQECEWLDSSLLACNSQSMNLVYQLSD